jgi:eukaryotic-like serine/threonine-protein kinase
VEHDVTPLHDRLLQALGATYDFERELARAGAVRVFLLRERHERRVVAKVLAPDLAAALNAERFAHEVALTARLRQANIVPVIDAGDLDGRPYYTMPWVEGQSLRARLDTRGAMSIADAIAIVRDVASALSHAHARGVLHGDINPKNILLSGHTAVVTDFGIASAIAASHALTPSASSAEDETPSAMSAYMAPEQVRRDRAADHRADIYALGVIAYELLAGERPFTASAPRDLIRAHATLTPPPLLARRPTVPVNLAALVTRCLAKDPKHRPASADEVLQALDRLSESPPDVLHGGAQEERPLRRRPVAMPAVLGMLLVLAAALAATRC